MFSNFLVRTLAISIYKKINKKYYFAHENMKKEPLLKVAYFS